MMKILETVTKRMNEFHGLVDHWRPTIDSCAKMKYEIFELLNILIEKSLKLKGSK